GSPSTGEYGQSSGPVVALPVLSATEVAPSSVAAVASVPASVIEAVVAFDVALVLLPLVVAWVAEVSLPLVPVPPSPLPPPPLSLHAIARVVSNEVRPTMGRRMDNRVMAGGSVPRTMLPS